ncbi:hypothetical protein B0T26DRAFT_221542 [Lasiosphaeria miniovina]|uniref:Uncharacterized protein n=1 Tax=Lasiosphaeria miniovina TaxID=1954250 RepID=A0AA40AUX8_9PEZI|nr:uncharacterized protein B0T26DRAFT_221542 [Lasiosphaeria miniovina]KAK0722485.1 hypothetical protein B0T26DRAFT_221542 [Lasiosphaeria miniovina]
MVDIGSRLGCITLNLGRNLANLGHGNLLLVFCLICLAVSLLLTVSTLQGGAGGSLRRQMISWRSWFLFFLLAVSFLGHSRFFLGGLPAWQRPGMAAVVRLEPHEVGEHAMSLSTVWAHFFWEVVGARRWNEARDMPLGRNEHPALAWDIMGDLRGTKE